ncbi:hypothetical protein G7046_g9675 [Stylonectria norvegica]|nr:hypothetical protein G7046_g9675 [Stylonectria norvegica]
MERELNRLRRQYKAPLSPPLADDFTAHPALQPTEHRPGEQKKDQNSESPSDSQISIIAAQPTSLSLSVDQRSLPEPHGTQPLNQTSTHGSINWPLAYATVTIPRKVGDVELNAWKIDGCLALFNESYAPYFPEIFDSLKAPNELYHSSVPLSWTALYSRFALSHIHLLIWALHFFNVSVQLDAECGSESHCSQMGARSRTLAAVCILRVLRSNLRAQVNVQRGEEMYFEAIRISRKRSIQSNDLDARNCSILTQIWSSTRLFKYKDGSVNGLRLLLRGRLSMSLPYDSHLWWRAEFGGKCNPYLESEGGQAVMLSDIAAVPSGSTTGHQGSCGYSDSNTANVVMSQKIFTDASEIPDWKWQELGHMR